MSVVKAEKIGKDGRSYRIIDDGLQWMPGGAILSIEVCQMYGECAVWKKVYDGIKTGALATWKEFRKLTGSDL